MEYGAIDLHTQESEIRIVTEDGTVVLERRIPTRPERLRTVFEGRTPLRVLLESGTESEWVAQLLETLGHTVVVADPNYLPMYGARTRRIKTDRRDVAALAEANRRELFRPAHRVSAAQRAVRQQLHVRAALLQMRTQAINVVRTQIRSTGHRLGAGQAETFARRVRAAALPSALLAQVGPLLTMLDALAPTIAAFDADVRTRAAADPTTQNLMTAPGVGPITALAYRASLDTVTRFRDAGAATAYLGLVPREMSSGERQRKGGITKAGPRQTRATLVQASWVIWRTPRGPAAALHTWVHQLAQRRGKLVAVVALARRLARILFAMWRDDRPFEAARVRSGVRAA
jgi:transposase